MKKTVIELFAGVGGFRVGLNNIKQMDEKGHAIENGEFEFVWANQWEPSTKVQHAFDCYNLRFNESNNSNVDISLVDKKEIPNHSLLCGGFPCQDYSVARSLSNEKGIEGKKGVLWWQIREILKEKKTPFVLLENVDRLIKAPSKQRGRDFGIMLRCFAELGYTVEWRIINAAEYGFPQRRRRIYIFAYKNDTRFANLMHEYNAQTILQEQGIFARQFPINEIVENVKSVNIMEYKDLVELSNKFGFPFENAGVMIDGIAHTVKTEPILEQSITLGQIIVNDAEKKYYLDNNKTQKFAYLRDNKKILRTRPDGSKYFYSEGAMSPVDELNLPGRTMLTSEGSVNRSTHIIIDPTTNNLRILTPVECERLNQIPDNWTNSGMPENRRYFMMGNALVCGIVKRLGVEINRIIENEA